MPRMPFYCPTVAPRGGSWGRAARLAGAAAAAAAMLLSACATLPDADVGRPEKAQPVSFETAKGPVPESKSRAILHALERASGSRDLLRKHLADEEAINRDSPLVLGNRAVLLQDGPATYKAMFAAIRAARDHINLETYIFEDGEIGSEFASLLLKKHADGVRVNVVYDSVGSIATPRAFFDDLRAGGIQLVEFNPVNPAQLKNDKAWRLNNRDHRKLLVVDGKIAFLGGINISESYSSGSRAGSASARRKQAESGSGWRDTHVQIEGPVVAVLQKYFLDTWQRQSRRPLTGRNYFPRLDRRGDEIIRAIASKADSPDSPIYLTLLSVIDHAERNIHLTNAYFVPDPKLLQALVGAARRGVDVQMILPGKTDSWAVFHAGRSHYAELLRAGVRLYERSGAILHSKTASVDGVWATVGSTNLDWRSFLHNDELNAVILGTGFAGQMDAMFAEDRAASKAIEPEQWARRPLFLRLQEWLARRFEYWL